MQTYEERLSAFKEITQHADIELKEIFTAAYHWLRYEVALRARYRAQTRLVKHGRRLDEQVEVLGFRAEMREF